MKKIKVFLFGVVFLIGMVAVGGQITTSMTAEVAIAQLSDDIVINSASRSVVKSDLINGAGYLLLMVGSGGLIYTVISKEEKKIEKS